MTWTKLLTPLCCRSAQQADHMQIAASTGSRAGLKYVGGPRLDTVMRPYPSFISYHRLCTLRVWCIVPGKILSLQMPNAHRWVLEHFGQIICPICQEKRYNVWFLPTQRITVESHNEYQSNRVTNRNGCKRSSSKAQGSSRHMTMEEQMIINSIARIWCEDIKWGVDCEDRDHWRKL